MKSLVMSGIRPGGIGEAIARLTALEEQWKVYALERDRDLGEAAARAIRAAGGQIEVIEADVSDARQVDAAMDRIEDLSDGKIDALVNNAGHAGEPRHDNLLDLDLDDFKHLVASNLISAFLMTQAVVKRFFLPAGGGSCVFLSTNNGALGCLGQLAYGTAKQSLVAMSRVLAAEFAFKNIRFNVVSPGIVETDSLNWQRRRELHPDWSGIEGEMNPMGRVARPDDVAHVVAFLISDKASFINACDIPVDGGLRHTGILYPGVVATDARGSYVEAARALRREAAVA